MKEINIYTAGLFDGEGTVTLCSRNKNKMRSPKVSIPSTSYELMEFLKSNYGGHISTKKKYKEHHKQSWSWSLSYNKVIKFLKAIFPYLREKEKIRRTNLILTQYKKVTPRNGKYTKELLQKRQQFIQQFFHPSNT